MLKSFDWGDESFLKKWSYAFEFRSVVGRDKRDRKAKRQDCSKALAGQQAFRSC
jgi:hypothetical protein